MGTSAAQTIEPKPLRILQVNSAFSGGGADKQTLDLAAGLRALGDDVTLAIPAGSNWEPLARLGGLTVETFPQRSALRNALIRSLVGLLRKHRIQVIHAHQGRDYWPAILAARLAGGAKVVVTRHLMTRPAGFSRWFLLSMADVIAVSKAVEGVCRRELKGPKRRIHQVYASIDPDRFQMERTSEAQAFRQRQGWPQDAVVFGVVGAYHLPRGKGQPEFLEAAASIQNDFPQARFAIVGSGTMDSLLRQEIKRHGLSNLASMIPFTTDVPMIMNALDVLVHPAVGTEALGLVILEALASGRPIIASSLDGITETFTDGQHGLLVPPGNVAELANAMRGLLANPEMRLRFGAAGTAHVRDRFSVAVMARRTREIYAEMLGA